MPVPRDYRAEYRARVERAKSKGFEAGYSEQRRAQRAGLGDDVDKWRAKAEQMRANADVMRRQIHDLGSNKTLLTTTAHGKGFGVIGGRLQGAGTGVVHIKLRDGSTRTVYGRGRGLDALRREIAGGLADVAALANRAGNYGDGDIDAGDIESVQIEIDQ